MTLRVTPAEIVERAEAAGRPGLLVKADRWPRVRLGDVARVVNGAAFKSANFNRDGLGIPLIRIRDVGADEPSTWYQGPFEDVHLVHPGDILVGMDGNFRLGRWRSGVGLLNQRVCRIDVDTERFDDRFLVYAAQGYLDAIWKATSSTTVKHLSSRSVADIPLPNPDLSEQRRIVEVLEEHLSHLDAAEQGLTATRLKSVALRTGMIEACIGEKISSTTLGSVTVRSGYGTSTKCSPFGAGTTVARIPNIRDGRIDLRESKNVLDKSLDLSSLMLSEGDLLIVRTNGSRDLIGRSAIVQPGINASFASYLIRFQVDASLIEPAWVHITLQRPGVRRWIEKSAASSAGQYNLSLTKLKKLRIPLPPLRIQRTLIEHVDKCDSFLSVTREQVFQATSRAVVLRQSLLAAAFSGRLTGRSSDMDLVEEMAGV
jgi:type I restriction enzyme, S subunit